MRKTRIAAFLTGVLAALPAISGALSADPGPADGFAPRTLAAHNRERARLGIAQLVWNDRLAADAQKWANVLASRNAFEHSRARGVGENLWMGTANTYSPEGMIGAFIDEARWFRPGTFPNVSTTKNWADVGHYSQLIWPATRELGCALARSRQNDVLVCRYRPAGNVMGRKVP